MIDKIQWGIALLFVAGMVSGCQKEEKKVIASAIKVEVRQLQKSNQVSTLTYSGSIEAENKASVGFSVSGVVNAIAVEEGDVIRAGQFLASLDDTEYQNALIIATAGLEQAEDLYKRLSELYEKGSLPAKDYIDIKTKVAQAKANQRINAKHIQDSRLVAPMSGIVTSKLIERGSTAAPGIRAFEIMKTDQVYARIAVPESEVGELQKGMAAGVFIPTLRDTIKGVITIVNPAADEVSRTYIVKIRLDNASGKLLPGMIARVSVVSRRAKESITVPATAILRDEDNTAYVYTSNANKKAVRKRVEVSGVTGNNEAIVTGLNEGDQVVVAGQSRLRDGSALLIN